MQPGNPVSMATKSFICMEIGIPFQVIPLTRNDQNSNESLNIKCTITNINVINKASVYFPSKIKNSSKNRRPTDRWNGRQVKGEWREKFPKKTQNNNKKKRLRSAQVHWPTTTTSWLSRRGRRLPCAKKSGETRISRRHFEFQEMTQESSAERIPFWYEMRFHDQNKPRSTPPWLTYSTALIRVLIFFRMNELDSVQWIEKKMKATLHVVEEFQQMNLPGNVAIAPERIPIDLGSSSANSLMMIVNSVAVLVSMEKKKTTTTKRLWLTIASSARSNLSIEIRNTNDQTKKKEIKKKNQIKKTTRIRFHFNAARLLVPITRTPWLVIPLADGWTKSNAPSRRRTLNRLNWKIKTVIKYWNVPVWPRFV